MAATAPSVDLGAGAAVSVVSGYKRSGTSMMMRCLKEMGQELHFNPTFESYLKNDYKADNPYFFEVGLLPVPTGPT
jgi:hypothetical protein